MEKIWNDSKSGTLEEDFLTQLRTKQAEKRSRLLKRIDLKYEL